jgi:hypothetical protein
MEANIALNVPYIAAEFFVLTKKKHSFYCSGLSKNKNTLWNSHGI